MDVGTYRESAMKSSAELVWITAIDDYWWTNYIDGIKYDSGKSNTDAYSMESMKAFSDSGSSCTYIPPPYYYWVMS